MERTLFLGEPDARSLELWNINVEVHRRGLELIRPGVSGGEIARELNEIYTGYGLFPNRSFGYGHSFGVLSHHYSREAKLELREDVEICTPYPGFSTQNALPSGSAMTTWPTPLWSPSMRVAPREARRSTSTC